MAHGPTRGELLFRLTFSLCGLLLLVAALVIRGMPTGPALFEVIGVAGVFFTVSTFWSGWKLLKTPTDD